jgi:hypothetical protein
MHNSVYDAIVEVIDPATRSVIARKQLDAELSGFIGPGMTVQYSGTQNHAGIYHVLRLRMVQQS